MGRILASPLFRSSKHYPNLLKHVVEHTLAGQAAGLKERSLGMEVFGRDPHYDTNADPVVRTSACEVRKRIAQYYHEPGRESEIRIELPAGSYVPEFRFPEARAAELAAEPALSPILSWAPSPVRLGLAHGVAQYGARHRVAAAAIAAATVILTAGGLAVAGVGRSKSGVDRFWGPVWNGTDSVLLCLGVFNNPASEKSASADPTHGEVMWSDRVAFADAVTMAKLTGLLQAHGKQYDIRRSSTFTLEDLHKIPAVLIGAFDNPWTMALAKQLRFTFEYDAATGASLIRDRQNPTRVVWRGDFRRPYSQVKEDYAIISRYMDPHTERMAVVVAGMGKDGTAAAGEFVTGPRYLETLASAAPRAWERKNLQVVIATEVINGNAGPPRVLATYFW
ncbi:MAG: hypothetical protein ACLQU1_26915 [Bryobacteraceae bacterium]